MILVYNKIFSLIPTSTPQTNLIISGDFNCILDPYLDKSSQLNLRRSNTAKLLKTSATNMNLVDVWRGLNPIGQEYSFFCQYITHIARLTIFFIDGKMLLNVQSVKYHSIVISDHTALSFTVNLTDITTKHYRWWLNTSLPKDPIFCADLEK